MLGLIPEVNRIKNNRKLYKLLTDTFDEVYVHEHYTSPDNKTSNICLIHGGNRNLEFANQEREIITEPLEIREEVTLNNSERDIRLNNCKNQLVKYLDITGNIIAIIDSFNNLYLCDFIHFERPELFELAIKIIKEYKTYKKDILGNVIESKCLKELSEIKEKCFRIKEISVKFDEKAYLKQTKLQIKKYYNQVKEIAQIKAKVLEERIKSIKRQFETEKEGIFGEALYILNQKKIEIKNNWVILKGTTYIDKIKQGPVIVPLPEKYHGKFFVKNIKILLECRVNSAKCTDAYHPNVEYRSRNKTVCLGDLSGKSLKEVIFNVEESFKTANLDSAYDGGATSELQNIFNDYEKTDEKGDKIWTA